MTSQDKSNAKAKIPFIPAMKRADAATSLVLFIASFGLYLRTLAPSLLSGDFAEFQTIGYTLGIGHPTGYPVYILLAKLFTLLPIGDIAYRVNLLSAFCAALTVVFVYLILRKLGAWKLPSAFGAISLALTPLFWGFSSMAEVYTPAIRMPGFHFSGNRKMERLQEMAVAFPGGISGRIEPGDSYDSGLEWDCHSHIPHPIQL